MKHTLLITLGFTLFLNSCELDDTKPKTTETPKPFVPYALDVLNENSGYTIIYDSAYSINKLNTGVKGKIGLEDFTIDNSDILNATYYTSTPTQQDEFFSYHRINYHISSSSLLSYTTDGLGGKYFPYSDFLVKITTGGGGFGNPNWVQFKGDITASVSTVNYTGTPDLGFRAPVCNSVEGFGYFGKHDPSTQIQKGSSFAMLKGGVYQTFPLKPQINFHEVYNKEYYGIGYKKDTLLAYKINVDSNKSVLIQKFLAPISQIYGGMETLRHYSDDGKKLAIMLKGYGLDNIIRYSTFTFNFETQVFTKNINEMLLPYSGTGTDIDLDEFGNIYYTGFAGNGSNTNGVSVYKLTSSGSATLVGNDNILKSGEIVGLKYINNKIYLAVTANQVGGNVHQISFIKQN